MTSPRRPWARDDPADLEQASAAAPQSTKSTSTLDAVARRRGPHDGADALRGAAPLADDATHVARRHAHLEGDAPAAARWPRS